MKNRLFNTSKKDKDDVYTDESAEKFINYIPRICNGTLLEESHPEIRKEINYQRLCWQIYYDHYNKKYRNCMFDTIIGQPLPFILLHESN